MLPLNMGLFRQVKRTLNGFTLTSIMCTQIHVNLKIVCDVHNLPDEKLPAGMLSVMMPKLRCSDVICECRP